MAYYVHYIIRCGGLLKYVLSKLSHATRIETKYYIAVIVYSYQHKLLNALMV